MKQLIIEKFYNWYFAFQKNTVNWTNEKDT